jgi:site-specific recombinase XerD
VVSFLRQWLPEEHETTMNNSKHNANCHVVCEAIEAHLDRFIAVIKADGYAPGSLSTKRATLRRFLQWRRRRKPPGIEPDESEVVQFLARSSRLAPPHRCLASTALFAFLKYLRCQGVISTSAPEAPETTGSAMEQRYEDFLLNDKGLAEASLRVYLPLVGDLLGYLQKRNGGNSVSRLDAGVLRAFLFDRTHGRSSEFSPSLATSLRSFLRFLHGQGEISHDLTAALPSVRRWAQPDIPRKLTPEEVDRVLNAADRSTATGRRDLAILLLLARLGLRASEVIELELADIRWRTGEILIRGKGGRRDLLPLPREVGAALARYLWTEEFDRHKKSFCARMPLACRWPGRRASVTLCAARRRGRRLIGQSKSHHTCSGTPLPVACSNRRPLSGTFQKSFVIGVQPARKFTPRSI